MIEQEKYQVTVPEAILAKEIGQKVLDFVKDQDNDSLENCTWLLHGIPLDTYARISRAWATVQFSFAKMAQI